MAKCILLQMQYHTSCEEPACYLHTAAEGERTVCLTELQGHIERENERLEQLGAFSAEEIVVRIEYRFAHPMPKVQPLSVACFLLAVTAGTAQTFAL